MQPKEESTDFTLQLGKRQQSNSGLTTTQQKQSSELLKVIRMQRQTLSMSNLRQLQATNRRYRIKSRRTAGGVSDLQSVLKKIPLNQDQLYQRRVTEEQPLNQQELFSLGQGTKMSISNTTSSPLLNIGKQEQGLVPGSIVQKTIPQRKGNNVNAEVQTGAGAVHQRKPHVS